MAVTVEQVRVVLKNIFDPEIHLSILDLGLIYGVEVVPDGNVAKIKWLCA
jgi:metal-sulfur cluster biosynthetic enzyme